SARAFPPDRFLERHLDIRALEVRYGETPDDSPADTVAPMVVSSAARTRVAETVHVLEQTGPAAWDRMKALGTDLAGVALPEAVARRLEADLARAGREGRRLRLWLTDHGSPVADWPWEYLSLAGAPLVLNPACSLVRPCRWPEHWHPPAGGD